MSVVAVEKKPQYLFLLFLIPIVIFIHINSLRTSKTRAIKFANFDAIRKINGVELFSKNITVLYHFIQNRFEHLNLKSVGMEAVLILMFQPKIHELKMV